MNLRIMPVIIDTSFHYLYFRNCAVNFVEICNIYVNQMVIEVAVSVSNSDNLSRSYDNLYIGVTFCGYPDV